MAISSLGGDLLLAGLGGALGLVGAKRSRRRDEARRRAEEARFARLRGEIEGLLSRRAEFRPPPGAEALQRRLAGLREAEAARFDEIARSGLRRQLGATGLLGSGAGAATLARAEADIGRRRDVRAAGDVERLLDLAREEQGREEARIAREIQARLALFGAAPRPAPMPSALGVAGGELFRAAIENLLARGARRRAGEKFG